MSSLFQCKMDKERKIMENVKIERYILSSNMRTSKLTCALSLSLYLSLSLSLSRCNLTDYVTTYLMMTSLNVIELIMLGLV